jgi:hypothetical protein
MTWLPGAQPNYGGVNVRAEADQAEVGLPDVRTL